jgi:hypothetical protein
MDKHWKKGTISMATAQLLYETDIPLIWKRVYDTKDGTAKNRNFNSWTSTGGITTHKGRYVYAVPLSSLQNWIRDKLNFHVVITPEFYRTGINYNWQVLIYGITDKSCYDDRSTGMYGDNGEYPTYEEALDAGLKRALEILLGK